MPRTRAQRPIRAWPNGCGYDVGPRCPRDLGPIATYEAEVWTQRSDGRLAVRLFDETGSPTRTYLAPGEVTDLELAVDLAYVHGDLIPA